MNDANTVQVAAMVINWNGAEDTLELLRSLMSCSKDRFSLSVALIDNNSSKADFEKLSVGLREFHGSLSICFRRNSYNVGVPAAYNQAVQLLGLDYDFYLRLDNDVVLDRDGLSALVAASTKFSKENVGIIGGNVKYFSCPEVDNGGAVSIDLVRGLTNVSYPNVDVFCDGVLGCIMLISGDVVRKYAPIVFDPELFICTDESELSMRAKRDGVLTLYISMRIGLHKSGASTGKVSFLSNYFSARNWTLHRFAFIDGTLSRVGLIFRLCWESVKSVLKGRFAYPVGVLSGTALAFSRALDQRVKTGK